MLHLTSSGGRLEFGIGWGNFELYGHPLAASLLVATLLVTAMAVAQTAPSGLCYEEPVQTVDAGAGTLAAALEHAACESRSNSRRGTMPATRP